MNSEQFFFEGIDTDTDRLLVSNKRAFDNLNCRQADVAGRGWVNQNMNGNAFDLIGSIGFELTAGFLPVGKVSFLGVAFIFSTHADGRCEIGTYPSPKTNGAGGYDKVYRPLQNYLGAVNPYLIAYTSRTVNGNDWGSAGHLTAIKPSRVSFTTNLFGWNSDMKVRVEAREDYDKSVNLYFCDWNHPDRVINCGFDVRTGVYTARTYFDKSFEQAVNQLNETLWPIELFDTDENTCPVEILNNGKFKCGNVHFYFRYANENFNHTSFVGHSEAVMIVPSNDLADWAQTIQGGPSTLETNKSVRMTFRQDKLDLSYRYLQIAYVRNLEDGGFDVQLIDKYFEIQEMISNPGTSNLIEITNTEDKVQLTIAEIIKPKRRDDISRDLRIYEKRLFHGNTKTGELYHPDLRDFALKITATEVNDLSWEHPIQFEKCTADQVSYKNYKFTYLHVGHFRKEWYPFSTQYLLTSGKWTDGFPTTGRDFYKGVNNPNGLFRFNSAGANNPVEAATGNLRPVGIQFNIDGQSLTPWMKANVVGMRIVRADRLENLVYQGLSTFVFKSFGTNGWDSQGDYGPQDNCLIGNNSNTELRPVRWDVDRFQIFYATTRLVPSINLLNVQYVNSTTPQLIGFPAPLLDLYGPGEVDSVRFQLPMVAQDHKTTGVFPWIYIFRQKPIADCHGGNRHGDGTGGGPFRQLGYRLLGDDDGLLIPMSNGTRGGFIIPAYINGARPYLPDRGIDYRGATATIPSVEYGKFAMYVPDFCMKQVFTDKEYFIDKIADWWMDFYDMRVTGGTGSKKYVRLKEANPSFDNGYGKNYNGYSRTLNIKSFFWDTKDYRYTNAGFTSRGLVYGVPQFKIQANHQFASYFTEGSGIDFLADQADDPEGSDSDFDEAIAKHNTNFSDLGFYYMFSHNKSDKFQVTIKNSEFATSAYLGLDLAQSGITDWYYKILNVYRRDPESDTQADFNPKNHNYFPIGNFIRFADQFPVNMAGGPVAEPKTFKRYQGDCFLQRTYLKTMTNPHYNVAAKDDAEDGGFTGAGSTRFTFGNIVGMITENATNTGVRYEEIGETAGADKSTFYPLESASDPIVYAAENKAMESYRYNSGYSKILSHQPVVGYDNQMPFRAREFPTRIWFTDEHTVGEIQDAWNMTELTSHRDFDDSSGSILRLFSGRGKFYSVYEHGVKMHFVNERAIKEGTSEGDIVLGTQSDVLSPKAYNVSEDVGIQQMDAADESDDGFYGIDMVKPCMWRVPYGSTKLEDLGTTKQVQSRLADFIQNATNNLQTDVTSTFPDNAISVGGKGIIVMYDRRYEDIYFGFALNQLNDLATNKCLIFNEKQNRFFTRTNWCPSFYVCINDDFYMVNADAKQKFYLSDIESTTTLGTNKSTFFGVLQPTVMQVLCNKEKFSSITAVFDAVRIIGNQITPVSVVYGNDFQIAIHNPFDTAATPIYLKPHYRENAWRFSIPRAAAVTGSHYKIGSHMRSQYVSIQLNYLSNLPIFVKSILVTWRPSKH